ncbi:DUF1194 domain-containing protein [Thalassobaculum sp. OXR-137]|uniref:DUF1194 domain-containing protein n=1 Tax=Thalassobaculum sp. OXR-137 TaxID=3100173 RepID=UPI002AC95C52|nr:DUF1194 domain-containing protein [Thalassobaculum sp. OXR-137]WPZ35199.1 DUF1194 domain-containing protein [Thalassobaculum sp. OXR-137]
MRAPHFLRRFARALRPAVVAAPWVVALACAAPVAQAQTPVDLALVLAVDSSASVDESEFALQRGGLAQAFRDPEVVKAIASGPFKRIAVTVIEWAGHADQSVDIPWTVVDGPDGATALADRIDGLQRQILTGATSIAGALDFANALLHANPFDASRLVIDLSGDGRNNQGPPVDTVRQGIVAQGVTINGLAIVNEHPTLNYYFEDRVIGGTAAFVEVANDYADYPRAIRRKLIREIRTMNISAPAAPLPAGAAATVLAADRW